MFEGSMVAIVTPFKKGRVDEKKFAELVGFHIKNGRVLLCPAAQQANPPRFLMKSMNGS